MDCLATKTMSSSFTGTKLRIQAPTVSVSPSSHVPQVVAFNVSKLLGGRGLVREDILKSEKANEILWYAPAKPKEGEKKESLPATEPTYGTFGKELDGLTGGFPGGERVSTKCHNASCAG